MPDTSLVAETPVGDAKTAGVRHPKDPAVQPAAAVSQTELGAAPRTDCLTELGALEDIDRSPHPSGPPIYAHIMAERNDPDSRRG